MVAEGVEGSVFRVLGQADTEGSNCFPELFEMPFGDRRRVGAEAFVDPGSGCRVLEEALQQVKRLEGILPICSFCKRVRDDADYWQQVESYIHACTGSNFSHGICPECFDVQVGAMASSLGQRQS